MQLSIIIPAFNEAESLVELYSQINRVAAENELAIEIIYIDDGSTDGSWKEIQQLVTFDDRVRGIRFRRNFGKAAALTAGISAAKGNILCMLDADLQDDPEELPRFLARLNDGFDVVNGWKVRRLDPWHKVYPSRVFNSLVSRLTGLILHDHNCGMKMFRAEVGREIRIYGELHRFIPVLAHARGFRVTEIGIHHRSRKHGHSKYGFRRFTRGFLDLMTVAFLTGYGQRPQHMLGAIGLCAFGLGFAGLGYLAVTWLLMHALHIWEPTPIGNRPLLAYSIALTILGAQAISLGLLAELLVYYTGRTSDSYSIAEEVFREKGA
ncbi:MULTISPECIES: glycosyltransferase [unclassified Schlesneria]|uniref:glycosyltransferase n=1 Tax=unclassified Schlesneria TaxID=2762017 RepID=UPI002F091B7F